jgi:DNA-binding MarR family transcriptional regulator
MDNGANATRDAWRAIIEDWLSQGQEPEARLPAFEQTLLFRQALRTSAEPPAHVAARLFEDALKRLEQSNGPAARLLCLRYQRGKSVYQVIAELGIGESSFYRLRNEGIDELADQLADADQQARLNYRRLIENRLEWNADTSFFGQTPHLQALLPLLTMPQPPWLICIEGIGGIGKTTLADRLVRQLLAGTDFVDFAWVSARPQAGLQLPALPAFGDAGVTTDSLLESLAGQLLDRPPSAPPLPPNRLLLMLQERLRQQAYLVVIDNLETVEDLAGLLPVIRRLAAPTKFLLTSRYSLFDEGDVYSHRLYELDEEDAARLIRHEAAQRNVTQLVNAADETMSAIYATVGGNPLALRLVVGQSYMHDLAMVLHDLQAAQGRTADQLYNYIYRRAWERLSEPARQSLIALAVTSGRGASLDHLKRLTGLASGDLSTALSELVARSLLDSRGDLPERRYTIHSLTRSFVLTQVGKWGV